MKQKTNNKKENFLFTGLYRPENFHQLLWNIKHFFKNIKYFVQRGKHGYAECDLWNFDVYLGDMLYNSLTAFANTVSSCPYEYEKLYGEDKCFEKWKSELLHMAEIAKEMKKDTADFVDKNNGGIYEQNIKEASLKKQVLERTFFEWMIENFDSLWE